MIDYDHKTKEIAARAVFYLFVAVLCGLAVVALALSGAEYPNF